MKKILGIFLFLLSLTVQGANVISDATTQAVTHCGVTLDTSAKVDVPVEVVSGGKRCKYDANSVTAGTHVIKMTYVNIDPTWGRLESVDSAPLTFTRPANPSQTPGGLVITF
jgi:hypothetical protein